MARNEALCQSNDMPRKSALTPAEVESMRNARKRGESFNTIGARAGVAASTVIRALSRTRKADEFVGSVAVRPPTRQQNYSWSLETIRAARDAQLRGDFRLPVRLAEALRTDDALFAAYHNRIAPQSAVQTKLIPYPGVRGAAVARKAAESVFVSRSVIASLHGTLANHGIAIGYIEQEPNDLGTCIEMRLTEWPLEHVRWNPSSEILETRVRDGGMPLTVAHGDGRWVVFRKFLELPWTQEACVLPASLLWAAHANGIRDWAAASTSHGQAKIVGELPEGYPLQDANGLTPQALAFLTMLQDLVSGEHGAGIRPFGSKTDFVANGSNAWQVFSELITNREKAAARIYLGTDAMLGSVGGAPGVDIATLFGVASTKVQGDFEAIEQALATGLYQPWTAINFGDSRQAPRLEYQMPDPDEESKSVERTVRYERLTATLERMRAQQMEITQETIDALSAELGVDTPPRLASVTAARVPLTLAPTDIARVVRVNEARASQGLPPLTDARGELFISELEQAAEAKADIAVDAAAAP